MDKPNNGVFRRPGCRQEQQKSQHECLEMEMANAYLEKGSSLSTNDHFQDKEEKKVQFLFEAFEGNDKLELMEMDMYSEICQLDNLQDLDMNEVHTIESIKNRSCSTKIVLKVRLQKVEKVRIIQLFLKTFCCKRVIRLKRNRETNIFQLEKKANIKVGECLECAGFQFNTSNFELRNGRVVEVGRCNLPKELFVVSTVQMISFCMGAWSLKSESIFWKAESKLTTLLCIHCSQLQWVELQACNLECFQEEEQEGQTAKSKNHRVSKLVSNN